MTCAGYSVLGGLTMVVALACMVSKAVDAADGADRSVEVSDRGGKIEVKLGGEPFTEYRYQGRAKPILYPVIGPGGVAMTRNYPMKKGFKDEAPDHVHHTSLWYTHGSVNGHDFWTVGKGKGKIVHDSLIEATSGNECGLIRTRNKWVSANGKVQCTDERALRFLAVPGGKVIDFDITIHAGTADVTFGDTKEGTMAIRTRPELRLTDRNNKPTKARCLNSEGDKGKSVWGKRAKWVDYWAPIGGKTVGVAIFDHPSNPRHPTWWHARDYGLVAANPFGVHHFERAKRGRKHAGDMKIKAAGSVTFRYRFLFHSGDVRAADIAGKYAEYAKTKATGKQPAAN